jgi:hypothetical protein
VERFCERHEFGTLSCFTLKVCRLENDVFDPLGNLFNSNNTKMANWYYYDNNGTKQGPITDQSLKTLAEQGVITPETILETESGQCGKAGQIRGLFLQQTIIPPTNTGQQIPVPVQTTGTEYLVSDYIGSFFGKIASVFGTARAKWILWQKMRLQIRKERAEVKRQEAEAYAIRRAADAELENAKASVQKAMAERESLKQGKNLPTPLKISLARHGASRPNKKGEDGCWQMIFDGRYNKITTVIRKLADEGIIVTENDIWKAFNE